MQSVPLSGGGFPRQLDIIFNPSFLVDGRDVFLALNLFLRVQLRWDSSFQPLTTAKTCSFSDD